MTGLWPRHGAVVLIAAAMLAVTCGGGATQSGGESDNVILLSTRFSGDEETATALTNLVRLQVSSTFQRADTDTLGRMIWDDATTPPRSQQEANRQAIALQNLADMVLWGNVYRLSDGIAVQAYLSVSDLFWERGGASSPPAGVWELPITVNGTQKRIVLGLPRDMFRLPEVIYRPDSAASYPSLDGLPIYGDRGFSSVVGRTGTGYGAVQYLGNAALIDSDGVRGWVRLDYLTEENNALVLFVGAVFRTMRGDYPGALTLLDQLQELGLGDRELQVNALLLRGLCLELSGESGFLAFETAARMAPLDAGVAQYELMGLAAEASRLSYAAEIVAHAHEVLESRRVLFSPDSNWFSALDAHIHSMGRY